MADQRDGGIAWTDATWNPVRGCSRVSEGCRNCYAEQVAARFNGPGQPYEGLAKRVGGEARWTSKVVLVEKHLDDPLRWTKPRRIFVNSMSDLFHEALPDEAIDRVFAVMALAPQHTFQILTKRAARMRAYMADCEDRVFSAVVAACGNRELTGPAALNRASALHSALGREESFVPEWPLSNVWLGVSVENQAAADERIPSLLQTPAAVRFLSVEPILGPVKLRVPTACGASALDCACSAQCDHPSIDWVIVGGESGPGARETGLGYIRDLVTECRGANVSVFVKQLGARIASGGSLPPRLRHSKGGDPTEWPIDLRVQEFPA